MASEKLPALALIVPVLIVTAPIEALAQPAIAQEDQNCGPAPDNEAVSASSSAFLPEGGETIYLTACAGKHQPHGQGAVGAEQYPPLAGNPRLQGGHHPAWIGVNGISGMPAVGDYRSDEQIVAVVSYL